MWKSISLQILIQIILVISFVFDSVKSSVIFALSKFALAFKCVITISLSLPYYLHVKYIFSIQSEDIIYNLYMFTQLLSVSIIFAAERKI